MTRIVAGIAGGRRLVTPAGVATRPTSERVRAALANTLTAAGGLAGARVLDLYAGSGALGLELLSRGAASVVLVERDRAALASARANVAALGLTGADVVAADALTYARTTTGSFDLIVADPPYELADADLGVVLAALVRAGAVARGADLVVERAARSGSLRWPEPLQPEKDRRYGDTLLCYGRAP